MIFHLKLRILLILVIFGTSLDIYSASIHRTMQFRNQKVSAWRTILYPGAAQQLPMHRHENDRVLVALTNGTLKITNNKGQIHYLHLKKNQAYYLAKDRPNETHSDENVTKSLIKVMVIELLT